MFVNCLLKLVAISFECVISLLLNVMLRFNCCLGFLF